LLRCAACRLPPTPPRGCAIHGPPDEGLGERHRLRGDAGWSSEIAEQGALRFEDQAGRCRPEGPTPRRPAQFVRDETMGTVFNRLDCSSGGGRSEWRVHGFEFAFASLTLGDATITAGEHKPRKIRSHDPPRETGQIIRLT